MIPEGMQTQPSTMPSPVMAEIRTLSLQNLQVQDGNSNLFCYS